MNRADTEPALALLLTQRGIRPEELEAGADGTIRPSLEAPAGLDDPPPLATGAGLAIGEVLGRGGMGVVRGATQRSLSRAVAVKTSNSAGPEARAALLREAWVAGHLEHPNIIPVHEIYDTEDGPALAMKRVEGRSWAELLGEHDLEWHLRVLVQVCHAVHYAHSRGLLHLDLKPDNVMIGEFGEIYVTDWGTAVSLIPDRPASIRLASELDCVIGTPAYMPPELAAAAGARVGPGTDVYMLGATLYELLAGTVPHPGESLMQALSSAYRNEPAPLPAGVPDELKDIVERAMATAPADRFATAAGFRQALERYLVHAESHALAADAGTRMARLEALFGEGAAEDADGPEEPAARLFTEARFALQRSLAAWPDNPSARRRLDELLAMMAERELGGGRWASARSLLAEAAEPPQALVRRVEEQRARELERDDELSRLKGDADLTRAARMRRSMTWLGGLAWMAVNVGLGAADKAGMITLGYAHMLVVAVASGLLFAGIVVWGRRSVWSNRANRAVIGMVGLGWVLAVTFWVSCLALDLPFEAALSLTPHVFALTIGAVAVCVDWRLFAPALITVVGATVTPLMPGWSLEIIGLAGLLVLFLMGRTWDRADAAPPGGPGAGREPLSS